MERGAEGVERDCVVAGGAQAPQESQPDRRAAKVVIIAVLSIRGVRGTVLTFHMRGGGWDLVTRQDKIRSDINAWPMNGIGGKKELCK